MCPNNSATHFMCFMLIEAQGMALYVIDFEKKFTFACYKCLDDWFFIFYAFLQSCYRV